MLQNPFSRMEATVKTVASSLVTEKLLLCPRNYAEA